MAAWEIYGRPAQGTPFVRRPILSELWCLTPEEYREMGGSGSKVVRPLAWQQGLTLNKGRTESFAQRWRRVRSRFTLEAMARVAADAIIINVCYLAALVVRLLLETSKGDPTTLPEQLRTAASIYASHAWLLTSITLIVFAALGFYTSGPLYRGRLKWLAVFHGVSLSYVIFGFMQYVAEGRNWLTVTPRLGMLLGWGFTLGATEASRL